MSWSKIENILEESAKHSTIIGKFWVVCTFMFRLIFVMRIGDTIYHDEQQQFTCNIRQPGCSNICFTKYSPFSFIRFCALHLIISSFPVVCYVLFIAHKMQDEKVNKGTANAQGYLKPILDRNRLKATVKGAKQVMFAEYDKKSKDKNNNTGNNKFSQGCEGHIPQGVMATSPTPYPITNLTGNPKSNTANIMPLAGMNFNNSNNKTLKKQTRIKGTRKKALRSDFDRRPSQVTISNQVITHSISRQNNNDDDGNILVEIEDFDVNDPFVSNIGHQKTENFQPLRRYSSDFSLCELPNKEKKIWTQNPFKIIFLKLKYFCLF